MSAIAVSLSSTPTVPRIPGTPVTFTASASGGSGSYEYQYYQKINGQWKIVRHYSTESGWTWDTTGVATGTHYFNIYARNAGSKSLYETTGFLAYTLVPPAQKVTTLVSPSAPRVPGTPVTLTAGASGGSGSYEYLFYQKINGQWKIVRPYSTESSWTWDTTGVATGTHYFNIYARNVGSKSLYETTGFLGYTLVSPAQKVTTQVSPSAPRVPGTPVTLTASASGGSGSYEYQYYQKINGQWKIVRPYSTESGWTWDTTGVATGTHYFNIYARNVGSKSLYETTGFLGYTLVSPAQKVTNQVSPSAPSFPGTPVTLTASASGGSGSYEYQYYQKINGQWKIVRPYSTESGWTWDTTGVATGTHYFNIYARNVGSKSLYETTGFLGYTLVPPPAANEVTMSITPNTPQFAGTPITFASSASGGSGSYEYQFYQHINGQWTIVQPYSAASSWTWDTTGVAPGDHYFTVYARSVGSTALYDVARFGVAKIIPKPATGVTLTATPGTPQLPGTPVTFTAAASGGSGSYEYQFYQHINGQWAVVQPYSAASSWTWNTTGVAPSDHYFTVYARSVGSTSLYDVAQFGIATIISKPSWSRVSKHAPWTPRDSAGEFVFQDKMWLVGGYTPALVADVWNSSNGSDWEKVSEIPSLSGFNVPIQGIIDNKLLITSNDGSVYSSSNGIDWDLALNNVPFGARYASGNSVFNGRLWALGGLLIGSGGHLVNDVWSSADGINWNQELANAPWSPRCLYGNTLVYQNKLWIFGGGSGIAYHPFVAFNDVWNTSDGINWNKISDSAPWPARLWSSGVVYKNRMWIFGGFQSEPEFKNFSDAWYSKDGVVWEKYDADFSWSARHEISSYVFQGKLWVIAGNGNTLNNDVWNLEIPGLIFVSKPVIQASVNELYQYNARADFNEDQEALNYKIVEAPTWLSVDADTGLLSGYPQNKGSFLVIIEATDLSGEVARQSFTIQVN